MNCPEPALPMCLFGTNTSYLAPSFIHIDAISLNICAKNPHRRYPGKTFEERLALPKSLVGMGQFDRPLLHTPFEFIVSLLQGFLALLAVVDVTAAPAPAQILPLSIKHRLIDVADP